MTDYHHCRSCGQTYPCSTHSFNSIPLVLPQPFTHPVTLMDCLIHTFRAERLPPETKCSCCPAKGQATKWTQINRYPFYLCFQLKRFEYTNGKSSKVKGWVNYPLKGLNLSRPDTTPEPSETDTPQQDVDTTHQPSETATPQQVSTLWNAFRPHFGIATEAPDCSPIYDLYAVVCHHGVSVAAGHYTAYALNPYHKHWLHFNDRLVQFVSEDAVINQDAYLLFYRRRCLQPPSQPELSE